MNYTSNKYFKYHNLCNIIVNVENAGDNHFLFESKHTPEKPNIFEAVLKDLLFLKEITTKPLDESYIKITLGNHNVNDSTAVDIYMSVFVEDMHWNICSISDKIDLKIYEARVNVLKEILINSFNEYVKHNCNDTFQTDLNEMILIMQSAVKTNTLYTGENI